MLIQKKILIFWLVLWGSTVVFAMDRPTEVERLRQIINDETQWKLLSEEEQNRMLADLFIVEQEEERLLRAARAELDAEIAAERKRKEASEQKENYLNTVFEQGIYNYTQDKPLIVEYLSTSTLQQLLRFADEKNNTATLAPLAAHYSMGANAMTEFIIQFESAIDDELQKRSKKPGAGTDFKSLIRKGLGNPPYQVIFETFEILEKKIQAIDLLLRNPEEQEKWAQELQVNTDQIKKALTNIKEPLLKTRHDVKEHVLKDLAVVEKERQEEAAARDHALKVLRETKELQKYLLRVDDVKKTYPQFFHGIPHHLEVDFLKKFEELYGNKRDINQVLTNLYLDPKKNVQVVEMRLIALGALLGYMPYAQGGYVFFDNGPRTQVTDMVLPKVLAIEDRDPAVLTKKVTAATQELVKTYKVHLMPDESMDAADILVRFDKALKADQKLSSLIHTFKILVNPTKQVDPITKQPVIFARVVIYAYGKEQAQAIINALYNNKIIRDIKGGGLQPRYNAKINDLIWAAQGDGDYKTSVYRAYYEQPHLIYYHPGITGKRENYHLINPATHKELVN